MCIHIHTYRLKRDVGEERNWSLMTLSVIHSGEIDCRRAKYYGSDRVRTPVPNVTYPVP